MVLDGREGRVLSGGRREMIDEEEWRWLEGQVSGDFDHLLIGNTLPVLLSPALHYTEAWNEAVLWSLGAGAARLGERVRQGLDLEHWSAFRGSFDRLIALVRDIGAGRRGRPPASIVLLGGDIHEAYLQEVAFRRGAGVRSGVYQAVCSPFRKPLNRRERLAFTANRSRAARGHAQAGLDRRRPDPRSAGASSSRPRSATRLRRSSSTAARRCCGSRRPRPGTVSSRGWRWRWSAGSPSRPAG